MIAYHWEINFPGPVFGPFSSGNFPEEKLSQDPTISTNSTKYRIVLEIITFFTSLWFFEKISVTNHVRHHCEINRKRM